MDTDWTAEEVADAAVAAVQAMKRAIDDMCDTRTAEALKTAREMQESPIAAEIMAAVRLDSLPDNNTRWLMAAILVFNH